MIHKLVPLSEFCGVEKAKGKTTHSNRYKYTSRPLLKIMLLPLKTHDFQFIPKAIRGFVIRFYDVCAILTIAFGK